MFSSFLFFLFFSIGNKNNIIYEKKEEERKIHGVHDKEHRKAKTEGKEKKKNHEAILREKNKLYKRETIRKTPAPRPIKKTMLAQIFQLNQRLLSVLKGAMISFCPYKPHQIA